jgi:hypothetical protein
MAESFDEIETQSKRLWDCTPLDFIENTIELPMSYQNIYI